VPQTKQLKIIFSFNTYRLKTSAGLSLLTECYLTRIQEEVGEEERKNSGEQCAVILVFFLYSFSFSPCK
jgi:hypothetical protein